LSAIAIESCAAAAFLAKRQRGAVHLLVFVLAARSGRVEAPVKTRANTDPAGEDSQEPVTIPATAKVPNGKILGP